jgi:hypothetical protein
MKFFVQRMYNQGVRLRDDEIVHAPRVIGDLCTHEERDENTGGSITVAALVEENRAGGHLLPQLYHASLVKISPVSMVLRGFERTQTNAGIAEARQEWWIKLVDGGSEKAVLAKAIGAKALELPELGGRNMSFSATARVRPLRSGTWVPRVLDSARQEETNNRRQLTAGRCYGRAVAGSRA